VAVDGTIGDIMDALEAALAVVMADFDLSSVGQVRRGRYLRPPHVPFVALSNPTFRRQRGPPMGFRETRATVDIVAWAASAGGTVHDRSKDALALLHQLENALDTAADTAGNALYNLREWDEDSMTLDSEVDGTPQGFCVAWVSLTFTFKTQRGL
jgi:hypothetical protein